MEKALKYKKKPTIIEAIQFTTDNILNVCKFIGDFPHQMIHSEGIIIISTLEGDMLVRHGDYVIKGIYEEFYPCKPEIFHASYEEITIII